MTQNVTTRSLLKQIRTFDIQPHTRLSNNMTAAEFAHSHMVYMVLKKKRKICKKQRCQH